MMIGKVVPDQKEKFRWVLVIAQLVMSKMVK